MRSPELAQRPGRREPIGPATARESATEQPVGTAAQDAPERVSAPTTAMRVAPIELLDGAAEAFWRIVHLVQLGRHEEAERLSMAMALWLRPPDCLAGQPGLTSVIHLLHAANCTTPTHAQKGRPMADDEVTKLYRGQLQALVYASPEGSLRVSLFDYEVANRDYVLECVNDGDDLVYSVRHKDGHDHKASFDALMRRACGRVG